MPILQATIDFVSKEPNDELIKTLAKFVFRFSINTITLFILLRYIYYRNYKRSELFFTFFIFNLVIFLICFLLNKVELSMGAAFGLFAVFSMLRYRTEDISIKDMTYLFLSIAIGLIAAITKIKNTSDYFEYLFIGFVNLLILSITWLVESDLFFKKESVKVVEYENINLILPERKEELIQDLKKRTGINCHRISIGKIDFLKDSTQIKMYYYETETKN